MPRSPRRRRYPNANGDAYSRTRANRVARVFRRAAAAMPDGYPRPARNAHAPTHRHAYAPAYRDAHAPPYAHATANAYAAAAPYAHAASAPYRHAAAPIDRAREPRGGRRACAA